VLLSDTPSFSFENIEADAAYNRQIKEQIRKEFSTGLEMLKAQADNMGMPVRDKDVAELKRHMYGKAIMMARCIDKAVTINQTISGDILLDRYVKDCIDLHLKFVREPHPDMSSGCRHSSSRFGVQGKENAPYDFLLFPNFESTLFFDDIIALRKCYELCQSKNGDPFLCLR
jgi:hypothetical protein